MDFRVIVYEDDDDVYLADCCERDDTLCYIEGGKFLDYTRNC
jgi:hypothetical protein